LGAAMAVKRAAPRSYWDGAGLAKLWCAFIAAPLAWLIDLESSYAIVGWACSHDRRDVLFLIPAGCLGAIGVAAWLCWSAWNDLRREAEFEGGSVEDRSRFLAVIGLMMSATFALLVVTTFAARYLLSPCD
jgi:hypothetical protein